MKGVSASKTAGDVMRRAAILPTRYGVTISKIQRRLVSMQSLLYRWDVVPTIPTTAVVLERHPEFARNLEGLDVAVHGYRHVAYADMSVSQQSNDLDSAIRVFSAYGLPIRGFRAPYLRTHHGTDSILASRGFLFDSSQADYILPETHSAFVGCKRMFDARYGAEPPAVSPSTLSTGLAELPVSFPDDVMLVDGLGITEPSTICGIFGAMLNRIRQSCGLLIMQVHPERFDMLRDAMESTLSQATQDSAWKASLSEVARWILKRGGSPKWPGGSPYAVSITGDLDALSLADFAARLVGE